MAVFGLHLYFCNIPNREPKSWGHFQARCYSTSFCSLIESLIAFTVILHSLTSMKVFCSICYYNLKPSMIIMVEMVFMKAALTDFNHLRAAKQYENASQQIIKRRSCCGKSASRCLFTHPEQNLHSFISVSFSLHDKCPVLTLLLDVLISIDSWGTYLVLGCSIMQPASCLLSRLFGARQVEKVIRNATMLLNVFFFFYFWNKTWKFKFDFSTLSVFHITQRQCTLQKSASLYNLKPASQSWTTLNSDH